MSPNNGCRGCPGNIGMRGSTAMHEISEPPPPRSAPRPSFLPPAPSDHPSFLPSFLTSSPPPHTLTPSFPHALPPPPLSLPHTPLRFWFLASLDPASSQKRCFQTRSLFCSSGGQLPPANNENLILGDRGEGKGLTLLLLKTVSNSNS